MVATELPGQITLRLEYGAYTAADWEQLPDDGNRYELIDGVLYMSTSTSGFHQWISRRINSALERQIELPGVAFVFYAGFGIYLPTGDRVQPDLVVIRPEDRDGLRDRHFYGVPTLHIEILSPGNAPHDTRVKLGIYARAGVPEYWVVRPKERDVLVHTQPDSATALYGSVTQVPPDGELVSPTLPFRARIADFFAGAPDTTL